MPCMKNSRRHFRRREFLSVRITQLPIEALVFMSWRAAIGGEAIPKTVRGAASAAYSRLAVTQKEELRNF